MFGAMMFVDLLNGLQRNLQQLAGIDHLIGLPAVVAVAAFLFVILFSEIVEQQFTTANRGLRVALRLKQQLVADADFLRSLVFLEASQTLDVIRRIVTDTLSFSSVTSGTTGLLVVSFERFRDVIVHDEAHIRFVNTHTERDSGDNNLTFLHQKRILISRTSSRIHSCVICARGNTVYL